jgi:hypothetical protein
MSRVRTTSTRPACILPSSRASSGRQALHCQRGHQMAEDAHMRQLGLVTVLDLDDQPRLLAPLWANRPVVLVFLRHFG